MAPRESDHTILELFRTQRRESETELDSIRNEAKKDRLCVAGKPWQALDPAALKERQDNKRPYLALDELGQYINQTVNDVRANPRAIKYAPTGNGANDKGAEFYQNHTREIEYRSDAPVAYARAFEDMVTASYGWAKIAARRQHVRTFDKDLWIEPVMNPDQILSDPMAVWPDSRDMKYLLHLEPWSKTEYDRRYGTSKASKIGLNEGMKLAPGWLSRNTVQIAEAWELESFDRTLVAYRAALVQGQPESAVQTALLDELPDGKLPAGMENVREEVVEDTRVKCYVTNGLEVLETVEWKGRYIPYMSCMGKVLYVDEGGGPQRQILSMTRLARDPYMLYCYIRTCEAEAIGEVPRSTWVGYEGQFAKPDNWKRANRKPVWALEAKVNVAGQPAGSPPLPLPQKQPWDPPLQNLEFAAEAARRAIQAAMGITPLPTPMQRDNQKSGAAMDKMDSSMQRGSFHFVDSYDLLIRRAGVILENLMDVTIDTARDMPVREPDDTAKTVRVNDPQAEDPIFLKGDYRVTVSTGPATESQRQEASEFVSALVSRIGEIAQMAGPQRALQLFAKAVKLKQLGPIGDEIVQLLDPQQKGQNGKPLPPEVAQMLGENKQLKQLLQQAQQEKAGKVLEHQGRIQEIQAKGRIDFALKKIENAAKIAAARITAAKDSLDAAREGQEEAIALQLQQEHDAIQADADRAHATALALADAGGADADRQHDVNLSMLDHQQQLEQGQQAAALAPPPAPADGAA